MRRSALSILIFTGTLLVIGTLCGGTLCGTLYAAPPPGGSDITPTDVFARMNVVHADLELIRLEMGRPQATPIEVSVKNAAPREVYFQAVALFNQANGFSFERARSTVDSPELKTGDLRPADVLTIVDAALGRLREVKASLGITEAPSVEKLNTEKLPTDVLLSIMTAIRRLNLLLDKRVSPADVYRELTVAVGYTSRLRAQFPGRRMPPTPAFERRKTPSDVYRKLLGCLKRIDSIAEFSGLRILEFSVADASIDGVEPADVYSLGSLIVAELRFVHSRMLRVNPPPPAYYPGPKLPAHAYQRASLLERQLIELEKHVREHPAWLAGRS